MIKQIEGLKKYNVCRVPVNEEERTNNARIEAYNQALIDAIEVVKNCSIPDVGLTLPLPDDNSMRQIAQHVRNSEESRDPLIYEQGIIRGMQIMKNIVSGN